MANSTTGSLRRRARKAAGNWQAFPGFGWLRASALRRPQDWTIVYTRNRDSDLLAESNAAVVDRELAPFLDGEDPDVLAEHHCHWAVGYVEGYAIRVWRGNKITPAFRKWCEIEDRLRDYPVLDEDDYHRRCLEKAYEDIRQVGGMLVDAGNVPETWVEEVYQWLWHNRPEVIEDHAAEHVFEEEDLVAALKELGYLPGEYPQEEG